MLNKPDSRRMPSKKKEHPKVKSKLHPRNKHRERYDFKQLIESWPDLAAFVKPNAYGDESVNFFDPAAVKALNQALLKHYYQIDHWVIPPDYLCPPIPGRADYLHHVADLLASYHQGKVPHGPKIRCLDVGVGANCIYPIIGHREYGWSFVGTEVDPISVASANKIIDSNDGLKEGIEIRQQNNPKLILHGMIKADEFFDLIVCNPPFHASLEEAQAGTLRKLKNLKAKKIKKPVSNFGGQTNELWYEGGEVAFVQKMIRESSAYANSCFMFSTLISKEANLNKIYRALDREKAVEVETIPMGQGNKISRIVAWTFFTSKQQKAWSNRPQ